MNISLQIVIYQKFYIKNGRYLHKKERKEKNILSFFAFFEKIFKKGIDKSQFLCYNI